MTAFGEYQGDERRRDDVTLLGFAPNTETDRPSAASVV